MKSPRPRRFPARRSALRIAIAGSFALPATALLAAPGAALAPAFRVTSTLPSNGRDQYPAMASNASGRFAIAWGRVFLGNLDAPDSDAGVRIRRYAANGAAQGGDIVIPLRFAVAPDIALDGAGNLVVVWAGVGEGSISAQRYSANGAPLGQTIIVESRYDACFGSDDEPKVAMDDAGDFVVAWENCKTAFISLPIVNYGVVSLSSTTTIHARRYNADCTPKARDSVVASSLTLGDDFAKPIGSPSVAIRSQGDYVLSWLEVDGTPVVRYYDADGRPINRESVLTDVGSTRQTYGIAPLGIGSNGAAALAYHGPSPRNISGNGDDDIFVQRSPSSSGLLTAPLTVEGALSDDLEPDLAVTPAGRAVTVWRSTGPNFGGGAAPSNELRGRFVSNAGALEGSNSFRLTDSSAVFMPKVTFSGPNRVAATWLESFVDAQTGQSVSTLRARLYSAR